MCRSLPQMLALVTRTTTAPRSGTGSSVSSTGLPAPKNRAARPVVPTSPSIDVSPSSVKRILPRAPAWGMLPGTLECHAVVLRFEGDLPVKVDYPIISADSHITEAPNTYTDYIDPVWRDRAPRLVDGGETLGDIFTVEGSTVPIPMGLVAAAGKDPSEI